MIGPACGEPETKVLNFEITTNWIAVYGICNNSAGTFPRHRPCRHSNSVMEMEKGKERSTLCWNKDYLVHTFSSRNLSDHFSSLPLFIKDIHIFWWQADSHFDLLWAPTTNFRPRNWRHTIKVAQSISLTRIPSSRTMTCAACSTPVYFEIPGGLPLKNAALVLVGSSCTCIAAHQQTASKSLIQ